MPLRRDIHRVFIGLRRGHTAWFVSALFHRIFPARPTLAKEIFAAVTNRSGLEIGGPSRFFNRGAILPLYPRVAKLDNANFRANTAWEAGLTERGAFHFDPKKPAGQQMLREAIALTDIGEGAYDFVLSAHCLEHVANPLAALREWKRVVRPGGNLILVLPDPVRSFDHARPVTTLDHLRADLSRGTREDDLTHLDEILAAHDLRRDPQAGSPAEFRARARGNPENRCLHHHVFDPALMRAALEETGWIVHGVEKVRPVHLLAFAHKPVG
jgi:SAM-dependent methyltransferase